MLPLRPAREQRRGAHRSTVAYDAVGRVTGVRNTKASGALINGEVRFYDGVGNPTHAALAWGSRVTWTYDADNRLVREQRQPGAAYDHTYTYDEAGNRLTKVDSGVTTTYSYDEADRLLTEDAAGAVQSQDRGAMRVLPPPFDRLRTGGIGARAHGNSAGREARRHEGPGQGRG